KDLDLTFGTDRPLPHLRFEVTRAVEVDNERYVRPRGEVVVIPVRGVEDGVGLHSPVDLILSTEIPKYFALRLGNLAIILLCKKGKFRHRSHNLDAVQLQSLIQLPRPQPTATCRQRPEGHEIIAKKENSHQNSTWVISHCYTTTNGRNAKQTSTT